MPMNLLQIVQEARGRMGQSIPTAVMSSTDAGIIQCKGLLNEFLEDLVQRRHWQMNTREATFVSTATESQGSLDTLAPYGFEGIIPDTFYNRTTKLAVRGGMGSQEWAARKAMGMSGPLPAYRLRQGTLLMSPVPAAGETYAFEYASSYFVVSADVVPVYRKYWASDTDTCTLDEALPMAYLKWAWRKEKGMDYGEDFRKYESLLATKAMRENPKQPIYMDETCGNIGPGVVVAPGSWPL